MERYFGGALCYGPDIEDGFYYDMWMGDRTGVNIIIKPDWVNIHPPGTLSRASIYKLFYWGSLEYRKKFSRIRSARSRNCTAEDLTIVCQFHSVSHRIMGAISRWHVNLIRIRIFQVNSAVSTFFHINIHVKYLRKAIFQKSKNFTTKWWKKNNPFSGSRSLVKSF